MPARRAGGVKGHCDDCVGYEKAIMEARAAGKQAPAVEPCDAYVMSDAFREFLVSKMRQEIFGNTQMAVLSTKALTGAKGEAASPSRAKPTRSKKEQKKKRND
jgi:hypothetical protein